MVVIVDKNKKLEKRKTRKKSSKKKRKRAKTNKVKLESDSSSLELDNNLDIIPKKIFRNYATQSVPWRSDYDNIKKEKNRL